jgi:hypothetical protein
MNTFHLDALPSILSEPHVLRMSQRLPIDAEILRRAQVAYVHMLYDSWQGTRAIEPLSFRTFDGHDSEPRLPPLVKRRVERVFRELLQARYPEWNSGAGSRGQFIWCLKSDLLEHCHEARFTTYQMTQHFDL